MKEFIWVLAYTGLRISDVALFHVSRLRGNELFLRAKKNGGDVFTWIPDWLRDQLNSLAKERGPRPFVIGGRRTSRLRQPGNRPQRPVPIRTAISRPVSCNGLLSRVWRAKGGRLITRLDENHLVAKRHSRGDFSHG